MDKYRNIIFIVWIICFALLGIVAKLAEEVIEEQMDDNSREQAIQPSDR